MINPQASAKDQQEIAAAATEAGAIGVENVASLGTNGKHPQNLQRDLLRFARRSLRAHWEDGVPRPIVRERTGVQTAHTGTT